MAAKPHGKTMLACLYTKTFSVSSLRIIGWLLCLSAPTLLPAQTPFFCPGGPGPTEDDVNTSDPPGMAELRFGEAVAISGRTALAGMPARNGAGRVGVYTRAEDGWQRTATLNPSNENDTEFGRSIDLDRNTAVIGAQNAVYVFNRRGKDGRWRQLARLTSSSAQRTIGSVVEYEQGVIATSAPGENLPGAVVIYERSHKGNFQRTARLMARDGFATDGFGTSLAMRGRILVVGAPGDANSPGAVYVFVRLGHRWLEWQRLQGSDVPAGGRFGASVAIRDRAIVVGAPGVDLPEGETSLPEGNAYVFLLSRGEWFESQQLNGGEVTFVARFGSTVAMGREFVAVSAPIEEAISRAEGHVVLFEWVGSELRFGRGIFTGSPPAGADLDFSGRRLIIGMPGPLVFLPNSVGFSVVCEPAPEAD
jgi:hypothetical protein